MPRVSVVVPLYNTEAFVASCLQSLQNQLFDDFEVICVNDGSSDASLEVAQSVVQEHGGRIWAESNVTGNRFCVLLPCNP